MIIEKLTNEIDLTKTNEYKLHIKAESCINQLENTMEKERHYTERCDDKKIDDIYMNIADDMSVKPNTEYHYNSDAEKDDKHNQSMIESLKKSLKKKLPHLVINEIYRKTNKEMLEKLQKKVFGKEKNYLENNN